MDEDYFRKNRTTAILRLLSLSNYRIYLSLPRTSPLTRKIGVAHNPLPTGRK